MPEIETCETCSVCGGNGLRQRRGKRIARKDTPPADRCLACRGDGALRQRRLRDPVLRGVRASDGHTSETGRCLRSLTSNQCRPNGALKSRAHLRRVLRALYVGDLGARLGSFSSCRLASGFHMAHAEHLNVKPAT
jgi:hypothetical protein